MQINPGDFTLAVLSQGALYCLLGAYSSASLASSRDWDCVGQVWPALVRCGLSPTVSLEKPSIGRLLDDVADRILRLHDTIGIYLTVSLLLKLLRLLPRLTVFIDCIPQIPLAGERGMCGGGQSYRAVQKPRPLSGGAADCGGAEGGSAASEDPERGDGAVRDGDPRGVLEFYGAKS